MKTKLILIMLAILAGCATPPREPSPFDDLGSEWNWNFNTGKWEKKCP